jgi:DNA-binding CsgD family transcriptional regulator
VPLLRAAHADAVPVMRPLIACDLVDAAIAAGDLDAARAAADPAGDETPWAAHAHAALLLAEGQPREAAAVASHDEAPPFIGARLRLLEGRALAAAGDRAEALRVLGEAEATLGRLGARRANDEAVRELRRLGHRVARSRPAADGEPLGALTDREREIAALVVAGRTNREVAEQLFLSPKTIEAHLRNVYAKLGVRSRVELARATDLTSPRSVPPATSGPQP